MSATGRSVSFPEDIGDILKPAAERSKPRRDSRRGIIFRLLTNSTIAVSVARFVFRLQNVLHDRAITNEKMLREPNERLLGLRGSHSVETGAPPS